MQNLECRYCGTNLGYLKSGDVYEVRAGQNHGPYSRYDDKGNPIDKKDIKPPEPVFKLTDRFTRMVDPGRAGSKSLFLDQKPTGPTTEEGPGILICSGCGEPNEIK